MMDIRARADDTAPPMIELSAEFDAFLKQDIAKCAHVVKVPGAKPR